eukprot:PITA_33154
MALLSKFLPFGLCNAPATFQRAILSIFADLINEGLEVYMDEFTPYGDDFDLALHTLENVLQHCIATRLCLSHEKCYMMMTEGLILGHYISAAGIQVDPAKIQIILLIPTPTTQMEDLKKLVSTAPVLQGQNWEFPFQISSDASDTAIGAVLGKEEDKKPYAIYYISKNLFPAELNYTVTEREFLAMIHAINKFRHYITGYPVILFTDHSDLRYLANKPITNGRITRWLILLQEFDITIKDQPGKENPVADFLSRMPKPIDAAIVEDQFPDEHLFVVAVKTPWYADVANFLAVGADMHIRRCVREDEIFEILKSYHDEPCGRHFIDRRTGHKVLQTGRDWVARLPEALWAYRTTWRSTTGYSPYQLVFGKQPIFPIEFEIQTLRTTQEVGLDLTEEQINRLQQINELDEIRLSTLQNTTLIQQQQAKWHDALIKNKVFHEGDCALLYDSRFQDFPGKLQTP